MSVKDLGLLPPDHWLFTGGYIVSSVHRPARRENAAPAPEESDATENAVLPDANASQPGPPKPGTERGEDERS